MWSIKKVFLKVSLVSQEVPVFESIFDKVAGLRPVALLKRDCNTGVFL